MGEEVPLATLLVPSFAISELLLALIGHLFDEGRIDPNALIRLLRSRIALLENEQKTDVVPLLKSQIGWLERLRDGKPNPPPILH